jgi:hypothetical protein
MGSKTRGVGIHVSPSPAGFLELNASLRQSQGPFDRVRSKVSRLASSARRQSGRSQPQALSLASKRRSQKPAFSSPRKLGIVVVTHQHSLPLPRSLQIQPMLIQIRLHRPIRLHIHKPLPSVALYPQRQISEQSCVKAGCVEERELAGLGFDCGVAEGFDVWVEVGGDVG